jgi:PKD repeat protein
MKKTLFHFVPALAILAILFASCAKEPTVSEIQATVDGYRVTFSVVVKNADTYFWDFGDAKTSTEVAPVHEYLSSGDFTVSLTVSGKGGEIKVTRQIGILPSVTEMLSGGPAATNGKDLGAQLRLHGWQGRRRCN